MLLSDLKLLLGINEDDLDLKLNLILDFTKKRLKTLLGGIEPPAELEYIIVEVAIIRFNRIGSEGLKGHSTEGENLTFDDSDFNGFSDDIQAWLDSQKEAKRGKVRFI